MKKYPGVLLCVTTRHIICRSLFCFLHMCVLCLLQSVIIFFGYVYTRREKQIPRLGHIFTYKCHLRQEEQPRVRGVYSTARAFWNLHFLTIIMGLTALN